MTLSSTLRRGGGVTAVLIVAGLALLHVWYPLPYVYRVMAYRGPDFSDIHSFPARQVSASPTPRGLPIVPDPRVAAVFEAYPEIDRFDTFLEQTETTAFLVVHDGRIVDERYLRGHDHESPQNTFSVSKSVASALVGLAVRDGVLEFDAPITRYVPELAERDPRFADVTVKHLLDMRSGIRYSDEVSFPFINADNALIYYSLDLQSVVVERTAVAAPPGKFQYNNYNPPLVGLILRRTTGLAPAEYLQRELWHPLGAAGPAGWTTDDRGFERMESGFHARARDLALFGQLYLDRGTVAGRPLVPGAWVDDTTQLAEPWDLDRFDGRAWGYRGGWWIVPRSSGPPDFCAIGHFGQFIYVSPQYDAVFVRTGPGRGDFGDFDWTALFFFAAERLGPT